MIPGLGSLLHILLYIKFLIWLTLNEVFLYCTFTFGIVRGGLDICIYIIFLESACIYILHTNLQLSRRSIFFCKMKHCRKACKTAVCTHPEVAGGLLASFRPTGYGAHEWDMSPAWRYSCICLYSTQ